MVDNREQLLAGGAERSVWTGGCPRAGRDLGHLPAAQRGCQAFPSWETRLGLVLL